MKIWDQAGIELATPGSVVRHVTDCDTRPGRKPSSGARLQDYNFFDMLNSTEHEIYPAHKSQNADKCWHLLAH